jgi:hypothetical protein
MTSLIMKPKKQSSCALGLVVVTAVATVPSLACTETHPAESHDATVEIDGGFRADSGARLDAGALADAGDIADAGANDADVPEDADVEDAYDAYARG